MSDPVQDARKKLIHIRYKLGADNKLPSFNVGTDVPPPPTTSTERNHFLANFLANVVGVQIKRAVTLGIGFLVGAGYLTAAEGDAQGAAIAAALSQLALTVLYALYDKFVKPHILKLLGVALVDAATKR